MPGWLMELIAVSLWCVWWLFAVDWRKAWPVLERGAWAPMVLLGLVSAYAWSRVAPGDCGCLGFMVLPNFWWQLGSVGALTALALFCGWLQGLLGCAPPHHSIEPPGAGMAHGHGHH